MAFSATDKQDIKRHLKMPPLTSVIDPLIGSLEDGSTVEQLTKDAIADCNTKKTAIATAQANADDLTEGGGAKFNHPLNISIKQQAYDEAVENLARIIGVTMPDRGVITGFCAL